MTQFSQDVNIIAGLTDAPVPDGSLTTEQYKAKFDEAVNLIKTYINEVLLVELTQAGNGVKANEAAKLSTARSIVIKDSDETNSGVSVTFDGSGNIVLTLPATIKAALVGDVTGAVTGNASTATKLAAAKNIGGAAFDGSADVTLAQMGAMSKEGGAFTGAVTFDGMVLTEGVDYGTQEQMPAAGTPGRIFFLRV